ncbi:hypothetical protein [Amycolatopsis sp. lyj-23]|uniref:hypothetical protein n=1 Tax=Amycolatopsis sp. lyj-23 TaxID=2789283 RepID=UPI00397DEE8A
MYLTEADLRGADLTMSMLNFADLGGRLRRDVKLRQVRGRRPHFLRLAGHKSLRALRLAELNHRSSPSRPDRAPASPNMPLSLCSCAWPALT